MSRTCDHCTRAVPRGRRTLCGDPTCTARAAREATARWRGTGWDDRRPGEWETTARRRAHVATLTRQGMSIGDIAIRLLGDDGPNQRRTIERDRASLRARTS